MPPLPLYKGRGATINAASLRFDDPARIADGDWLDDREHLDDEAPPLRTSVTVEHPRTIITRNRSPDIPFNQSINAYRGCEHGCIYCFARPTHAYLNLSPGLDFESRLFAKPDAARLLKAELGKRGYKPDVLALGTNTDPYQPIEMRYRITRSILQLLSECEHPTAITTKSARILHDLDLLASLAARGLLSVVISVTSLDPQTTRLMEPRAASPKQRLLTIRKLAEAGIPTYASLSPIIPAINDHEIENICAAVADAGAAGAYSIMIRLPQEVAPIFRAWLSTHYPDRAKKVMALIQDMRGGQDNSPDFFDRFLPQGPYDAMLRARFVAARRKHGLDRPQPPLRTDRFRPPPGDQGRLF